MSKGTARVRVMIRQEEITSVRQALEIRRH
jgi:hypothetical protein